MSKKIAFNVNAYTAKLIGRENVSSLDGAILELVKNAYDADADICILYYEKNNKALYLMDNGTGMSEETIKNHWMTIGNSSKHTSYITKSGRIQTGAKGIGRFALDRVGDNCTMYTKNSEKNVIEWSVDWSDFERYQNLTDITANLSYINLELYNSVNTTNKDLNKLLKKYFSKTGTIFKICNMREEWNDDLIKNIKNSLSSLIPPEIENQFKIYVFNGDEDNIKNAEICSQNIDKYDYKISFDVAKSGKIKINIHRNEFDFKDQLDKIIREENFTEEDRKYFLGQEKTINTSIEDLINYQIEDLGNFNGILYFNKITTSKDDAAKYFYKENIERKNYADFFGGIRLYRDNFRVRPYGEKDSSSYDWLLLGKRNSGSAAISHQKNPWRVTPAQITGVVNISRINVNLPDQANRQGIVETPQFKALKEIIIAIISQFEQDRQYVGRKLSLKYDKENPAIKFAEEIKEKSSIDNKKNLNNSTLDNNKIDAKKAQIVIDSKNEEIQNLENENRMLRNLATVGIISNQYIHETRQAVNDIGVNLMCVLDDLNDKDIESALIYLDIAQKNIKKLDSWFDVTINSIRRDKRKMQYVKISSIVSAQLELWQKVLSKQNITINKTLDENLNSIKCFPYEIESIISNLISNSVAAFADEKDKNINISFKNASDGIIIQYSDTGKGLELGYKKNPERILGALETNRRNSLGEIIGTGLGMWIIKNIVDDYNGEINLQKNKNLKKGFYIEIKLKTLKKGE